MNLWTFVMLVFLAQSSNGASEIEYSLIANMISVSVLESHTMLKEHLLSGFGPSSNPSPINPSINKVTPADTTSEHKSEGLWHFSSSGSLIVVSTGFTDVKFEFQTNGEIELDLENGYPIFRMLPEKLSTSLKVETPVTGTLTSGNFPVAYMDNCNLQLTATIQQACYNAIASMNLQFQQMTNPFPFFGRTCKYQVPKIQYLSKSLVCYVDLVMDTPEGVRRFSLYSASFTTSTLQTGWTYACSLSQDFISQIMSMITVSYKQSLTELEHSIFQLFKEFQGKIVLEIEQNKPFAYKITPEESKATAPVQVSFSNEAGNHLAQYEVPLSLDVDFQSTGPSLWLGVRDPRLIWLVFSTDQKISSSNSPTPKEKRVIEASAAEAIMEMQNQMKTPMPIPFLYLFASPTKPPTIIHNEGFVVCGA